MKASRSGAFALTRTALVCRCCLVWHIPWSHVGGIKGEGSAILIQADPSAHTTWDSLVLPRCDDKVPVIIHALHQAWMNGLSLRAHASNAEDEAEIVA